MLGIDLGSQSLKYVISRQKKAGRFELVKAGHCIFPADVFSEGEIRRKATLVKCLQDFWTHNHLPRDAAVSFYHPRIVIQTINIPEMSPEELENALRWEASSLMPGEEDFQIGWQVLGKNEGQQEVLFSASPSLAVSEFLDILKKAGIRLEVLEPHIISLVKGFLALHREHDQGAPFIIADIGFAKSAIVFFEEGNLVFSRYFGWGLKMIWDFLREQSKLLPAEIMELFSRSIQGKDIPYQMEEALAETTPDLYSEIKRSFTFFQTKFGPKATEHCYLSGGGAGIIPLRSGLSEYLGLPLKEVNSLQVEKGNQVDSERYLSALGVSLWN